MFRRIYILIIFTFSTIVHGQNSLSQETEVLARDYQTEIIIFLHRDDKSKITNQETKKYLILLCHNGNL